MRKAILCAALFALALAIAAPTVAGAQSAVSKARRWKVIVLVPEQHLDRARIPDPAVETALCRRLIDAGYKVMDQERVRQLRYASQVDRLMRGGAGAAREAVLLGRRFGADLLVTGEAFTQEAARTTVHTSLGTVARIQCRARVELKGIRTDTGERFYAASTQKTGPPEATVELASKACLEEAADTMAAGLVEKLDGLAMGQSSTVEIVVRGVSSISEATALERALAKLPGVLEVSPGNYDARVFETEVVLAQTAVTAFRANLEHAPTLKRFRLKVVAADRSRITADRR